MNGEDGVLWTFGRFTLDPGGRILTKDGDQVAIQDKPLDLLLYLIRHRDRVVPRREVLREVWPGVTVGPLARNHHGNHGQHGGGGEQDACSSNQHHGARTRMTPSALFSRKIWFAGPALIRRSARVAGFCPCAWFLAWIT